jgi:chromodomain-helicase-DNA-binding protein 4
LLQDDARTYFEKPERIVQIGKKKLVLDHLIVQKMDDDEENAGENVQSILTYGAEALFESEETSRDITCRF